MYQKEKKQYGKIDPTPKVEFEFDFTPVGFGLIALLLAVPPPSFSFGEESSGID